MPQATTYRCWQPKVSYRFVTSVCIKVVCVCVFVCIDVFGKQKEIISKICSSCNGCVWKCVWVCLCWLRLLCFVRSVVMKMEIRFGFPLRAFGERVWNCQKSYETFILFSFLLLLLLFLLFDALLRTTRGRGRRRELPLVALLQTLCICQADCPTCPLVFPPVWPFSFGNTHLKCTSVFPQSHSFPLSPLLFAVYYSLVVKLNKLLSRGAFLVLTFECFWHLYKFVLISLLHTANWHVFKRQPQNVKDKVENSSKTRDLRRVCLLNSWESY